jgi:probable phosphoglycerate mutase
VLLSSAYPRARETAEIIAPALGVDVQIDAQLGEHDPGPDCDGMTFDAFVDRFGMPDWTGDPHAVTFPGGETTGEFHLRVGSTLSRLVSEHSPRTIVAVCHGGVIDVAFRYVLRLPTIGGFELYTTNASITEFLANRPTGRLLRYNDSAHLAGLPIETPRRT